MQAPATYTSVQSLSDFCFRALFPAASAIIFHCYVDVLWSDCAVPKSGEVWDNTQKFFGDMWEEIK